MVIDVPRINACNPFAFASIGLAIFSFRKRAAVSMLMAHLQNAVEGCLKLNGLAAHHVKDTVALNLLFCAVNIFNIDHALSLSLSKLASHSQKFKCPAGISMLTGCVCSA